MTKQYKKRLPAIKIILIGQLIINLPVTIVIIISAIILAHVGLSWNLSIFFGAVVGFFFWGILLEKWKLWALKRGVERERLFKLGKIGLLNFYRYKIFDDKEKIQRMN